MNALASRDGPRKRSRVEICVFRLPCATRTGGEVLRHEASPRPSRSAAVAVSRTGQTECPCRGRLRFSASTCCRKARFSTTRSDRDRRTARRARTKIAISKMKSLNMGAHFDGIDSRMRQAVVPAARDGRANLLNHQMDLY